MKVRLVSAAVALVFLGVVLLLYDTLVFNFVAALVGILAVYEILQAEKFTQHPNLAALCIVYAGVIPLLAVSGASKFLPVLLFAFITGLFVTLIVHPRQLTIEQACFCFSFCTLLPLCMFVPVFIRDYYSATQASLYYTMFSLGGSWFTDAGALFIGTAFGRNKLAPTISPKKTVEGAFGGVAVNLVYSTSLTLIYSAVVRYLGYGITVDWVFMILFALAVSAMSIIGDLVASIIKRQCGIKDFGNIMPGHGGVLDRFDSVLFALPMMYISVILRPIIVVAGGA